ncbi:SDR family NAD(P)-dependent oxidoreductase [Nocardia nova]|jgi:3-oxoacyl-[acyl-carrier protein] reductase|uniref:SDR family NAD(P)-dependent oxidoreductase n=1 Tax=Nocardia nova TaxID=37330 RepID=UPI0018933761|nr:SDR family NAD(P)-dependent oxidoreductase [Nocardia nova]MBF6147352.1 SDR family NAD(P)-dependent oxidoreductase [Nocardia nova]
MAEHTRVALVTGASGGIGRAVARRLAADGMAVGVHYAGNKVAADELVAELEGRGGRALAVGGDVADEHAGTPEDIAEAVAFLGGPGRWINGQVLFANGAIA